MNVQEFFRSSPIDRLIEKIQDGRNDNRLAMKKTFGAENKWFSGWLEGILEIPQDMGANTSDDIFCFGTGYVMMNGFQVAIGATQPCALLLACMPCSSKRGLIYMVELESEVRFVSRKKGS